jgi:aryl-alcohol dehydrogenase-like predicted oxidoreductase
MAAAMNLRAITDVRKPGEPVALALGTMNFGKRTPEKESERIVARAIERGITAFDTANVYSGGESERILGRAVRGRRERVAIATKVGLDRVAASGGAKSGAASGGAKPGAGKAEGLSRAAIARAIDASLERLSTDYVDVYYLHAPDHATPIEETMDAMKALVDAGKVRAWGVSNYAAWQILEMNALAAERAMPRPASSQVLYNLVHRQLDIEYFGYTRRHPIHSTIYNPLAGGLLTGMHTLASGIPKGSRFEDNRMYQERYWTPRMFELVESLRPIAASEGMTLLELAYAWVAGRDGVDSILVGPGSVEHLDAAIDACARVVSSEGRAKIDAVYRAYTGTATNYVR